MVRDFICSFVLFSVLFKYWELNWKPNMETRFIFHAEWFDKMVDSKKEFIVTLFPEDNSVEMYDVDLKRLYLRRIKCDGVSQNDFFIGNSVVVFSRRLLITGYEDKLTSQSLHKSSEATLAMIKPDGAGIQLGAILEHILKSDFRLGRSRMVLLSRQRVSQFYAEHQEKDFFPGLLDYMSSGPVLVMELLGNNAVRRWRNVIGPTDSEKARIEAPESIRAIFGTDTTRNVVHGSDSTKAAIRELKFFFENEIQISKSELKGHQLGKFSTCCVLLPHVVRAGLTGSIIRHIQDEGFIISGFISLHLTFEQAEEFLLIYKGIAEEFAKIVRELSSGRSVALIITHSQFSDTQDEIVSKFRDIVGPADPELARTLRPKTLRAVYGISRIQNSVHVTDLPEDAILEVEYFFSIICT